jgi:hypothetical protein
MDKKKDAIDVEIKEEKTETPKEEKKEKKGFGAWWNDTKSGIKKTFDDSAANDNYDKTHTHFDVYSKDGGLLGESTIYGTLTEDFIIYRGDEEIKEGDVIIDASTSKAYFAKNSLKDQDITFKYEDKEISRKGIKVFLDSDITEVKVIKCGKRFFLKK